MITWIINIFLSFFFLLDTIMFGLIESLYKIILQIANIAVISQADIQDFANRIYVLIGVVMLFKVAFSLIQMFANPDKLTDSKSGTGNLIKRIIISLVMLVMAPTVFQLAFRIQGVVLKSQILEKVILDADVSENAGDENIDCSLEENQKNRVCGGRVISFALFRGFVSPSDDLFETNENGEQVVKDDGNAEAVEQYNEAVETQDIGKLLDPILAGESGDRPFNYSFLVSTIAGGFAGWMLFMFCFDVAIRAVKLTFLQLLAPIPILSYVDPKGEKVFDNWKSQCISTYLEVFMRLITLYFVVYIIQTISAHGLFSFYEYTAAGETAQATFENLNSAENLLMTAFIILGLLMFATSAPKWIADMFGIKAGDFTLNPMKKLGSSPLAAAAVGGVAGFAGGFASNAWNLGRSIKANGLGKTMYGKHYDPETGQMKDNEYHSGAFMNALKNKSLNPFAKENVWNDKDFKENRRLMKHAAATSLSWAGGAIGTARRGVVGGIAGKGKGNVGSLISSNRRDNIAKREQRENWRKYDLGVARRAMDSVDRAAGYKNKEAGYGFADERSKKLVEEMDNLKQQELAARQEQTKWATANQISMEQLQEASAWDPDKKEFKYKNWEDYMVDHGTSSGYLSEDDWKINDRYREDIHYLDEAWHNKDNEKRLQDKIAAQQKDNK